MNPLNLAGPAFLLFYVTCWALFALLVLALRKAVQRSSSAPSRAEMASLIPYEMAYLVRGPSGTIEACAATLVAAGHLEATEAGLKTTSFDNSRNASLHPLERALLSQCTSPFKPLDTMLFAEEPLEEIRVALADEGFLVSDLVKRRAQRVSFWCGAMLLVLGVAKLFLGLSRGRPVALLAALIILGAVALSYLPQVWPSRTLKGTQARRDIFANHAGLDNPSRPISVVETSIAAGIFGLGVVGNGVLPSLFVQPQTPSTRSWGSVSSCGGSSCGGGGCGGGCGGCGS